MDEHPRHKGKALAKVTIPVTAEEGSINEPFVSWLLQAKVNEVYPKAVRGIKRCIGAEGKPPGAE